MKHVYNLRKNGGMLWNRNIMQHLNNASVRANMKGSGVIAPIMKYVNAVKAQSSSYKPLTFKM